MLELYCVFVCMIIAGFISLFNVRTRIHVFVLRFSCVFEFLCGARSSLCQRYTTHHMKIYIPSHLKHLDRRLNFRKENHSIGTCERNIKTKPNTYTHTLVIHTRNSSLPSTKSTRKHQANETERNEILFIFFRKWNNKSLKYLQYHMYLIQSNNLAMFGSFISSKYHATFYMWDTNDVQCNEI